MEFDFVILLTILALFLTILIPIFLKIKIPTKFKDVELPLTGMGFLSAIMSFLFFISAAGACLHNGLYKTFVFGVESGGGIITDTYVLYYSHNWVLATLFIGISIIPFMLFLFLVPESWKDQGAK